jgi:ABC-type enterobactin transport system permease subunit
MVEEKYRAFLLDHLHTDEIGHSRRDFYAHLKGTHDLLRAWKNSEAVCVAGLFHSIYGTWHFRHQAFPIDDRQMLRRLIGEEAEFLVYVFCVTERPRQFLAAANAAEIALWDHHADDFIRLSRPQLNQLLEIEAANLVEQGGKVGSVLRQLLAADISPDAKIAIAAHLAKSEGNGYSRWQTALSSGL